MRGVLLVLLLSPALAAGGENVEPVLKAAQEHIGAGKLADAQAKIDEARKLAGDDREARDGVAYLQATLFAYRGDWDRAADALLTNLPETDDGTDASVFWTHNTVMMLREAQGDVAAAIVECEEMTRAGQKATWGKTERRERLVLLKDLWHRAYLFRMLAEQQSGSRKATSLRYADEARRGYAAAAPMPDFRDSLAVLDGYFAALDGDAARALEAAKKVDVEENGDLEDLYLAKLAFEAGGDAAGAAKVRARIEGSDTVNIPAPIMRGWIKRDLQKGKRFTPRYPRAKP